MNKFIRLQNTDGNEVIINVGQILKIVGLTETPNIPKRTRIELINNEYLFTYLSTDIMWNKIQKEN